MVKVELEVVFSKQARMLLDKLKVSDEEFFDKFSKIVIGGREVIEYLEGLEHE